jgi:hypothetical protein
MNKIAIALMIAVCALGATACSTDGGAAAARVQQEMNRHGGPN